MQAVNWDFIQGGGKGLLRGVCLREASQSLAPWSLWEEAGCCPPYLLPGERGCPASLEALPTSSSASVVALAGPGRAWQVARAWDR